LIIQAHFSFSFQKTLAAFFHLQIISSQVHEFLCLLTNHRPQILATYPILHVFNILPRRLQKNPRRFQAFHLQIIDKPRKSREILGFLSVLCIPIVFTSEALSIFEARDEDVRTFSVAIYHNVVTKNC
jgi:hypothetical protein